MTPEERALERFTREKQRRNGASLFNLDEASDEEQLTHLGQTLSFGGADADRRDDFDAESLDQSSADEDDGNLSRKRRRESAGSEGEAGDPVKGEQPERKKTKAEVMKEVMAKSKLYKYERQKAKEEDDELRDELDKGLPDILAALAGHKPVRPLPAPTSTSVKDDFSINPDRAMLLNGMDRSKADREYDTRLKQMAQDKRAAPTTRTKTEEEKAQEEAERLKKLEEQRLRRMRGESVTDEEDEAPDVDVADGDDDVEANDAAEFGLEEPRVRLRPPGIDDEDDFILEDDLVASASEIDEEDATDSDAEEPDMNGAHDEEDDEFAYGLLSKEEQNRPEFVDGAVTAGDPESSRFAYTYPCPRTHQELSEVLRGIPAVEVPTVVQRIRALYHPQLQTGNKEKLADFSAALVDHISYMALQKPTPPLTVVETLIRHIHSLSRTYPETIAKAFRSHLQKLHPTSTPTPGDLVILTAIGSIFPTSDHFHQVVTPAITVMARWLGMTTPQTPQDLTTGAYIGALCLQYQRLSKRYIPELVRFTVLALHPRNPPALVSAHVSNLLSTAELWASKSAFAEIFAPAALGALGALPAHAKAAQRLRLLLAQARLARRPLELHHHRPLAVKSAVPKFEEAFNPAKHYDPDAERREAARLRAEHKKERKGALRELRKDASFVAREQLRAKKERDRAYEDKFRRVVAEIQGEEGREAKEYERVKRLRKGGR